MNCRHCGEVLKSHLRECPACGEDNGYPNVRVAGSKEERNQLLKRYQDALTSTTARNCRNVLEDFGEAVKSASAVWARSLAVLQNLTSSPDAVYVSFARQVAAGARYPEENEFDKVRLQYEGALFPYYGEMIVFASLTLNKRGISGYGAYSIFFKEQMIAHRATVFEENPHLFVEKHKVLLNQPIPPGYRSTWAEKHILAQAKLHSKINGNTKQSDYANILATDGGGTGNSDFIEVHIYGSINSKAIERVVGSLPRLREDRVIWKAVKESLVKQNVEVEEQ